MTMSNPDGVLLDLDEPSTREHVVRCDACKHTLLPSTTPGKRVPVSNSDAVVEAIGQALWDDYSNSADAMRWALDPTRECVARIRNGNGSEEAR